VISREIADKAVPEEVQALEVCRSEVHAIWEPRFNAACASTQQGTDKLPQLHADVMCAIEAHHQAIRSAPTRPRLRMSLTHRHGTMHQVVEAGRAGWIRGYRALAAAHRASMR
jgi:hypothetical protein